MISPSVSNLLLWEDVVATAGVLFSNAGFSGPSSTTTALRLAAARPHTRIKIRRDLIIAVQQAVYLSKNLPAMRGDFLLNDSLLTKS